ncbi:hypothetical protein CEO44_27485 [Klebsiella pneumoniae]|uniref:Uncharacterized protein n=3 Tax=Enterobacteriaceae TaxID=543 RepID=A0A7D5KL59_ENTCL|nr:hypothetical protein A225_NDM1p0205 [Klebsiella michiganensis E718]ASK77533.1 hypothetical protein CF000_31355 [Klebsiella michiganensis]AST82879.1 hypothetical protein CI104_27870 [Citrobacter farmeri]ATM40361.1 hypothetical protein CRN23_26320 [Klebsiella pneumoniae]ATO02633.1 hypothetical protein AN676_0328360 [Klebsiella pneumoniae subsp. pneumoniae]AUS91871.1 hypothetical protein [Serratia marcescens]AUS92452.1 hypothetical protein [Enterobacter cloacae]OWS97214.1 hypothetical protei
MQHPYQDAPPLSRRGLRSLHPGENQRPPGCKGQRRFAPALSVVAAGSCSFLAWFFHPFESFRRG